MNPRDDRPLLPGEPSFTLRGNDPLAGFLVSIWASAHAGDGEAVAAKIRAMLDRFVPGIDGPGYEEQADAIDTALAMFAWRDRRSASGEMIRESTKSDRTPAAIALHRWTAEIDYRHDDGIRTSTRGLHDLAELQDIVEDGPSFYAIAGIRISAPRHSDPVTVEEAARQ